MTRQSIIILKSRAGVRAEMSCLTKAFLSSSKQSEWTGKMWNSPMQRWLSILSPPKNYVTLRRGKNDVIKTYRAIKLRVRLYIIWRNKIRYKIYWHSISLKSTQKLLHIVGRWYNFLLFASAILASKEKTWWRSISRNDDDCSFGRQ